MAYNLFRTNDSTNRAIELVGSFATSNEAWAAGHDLPYNNWAVASVDFDTFNTHDQIHARLDAAIECSSQQASVFGVWG